MLQIENDPSLDVRKRKAQLWSRSEVVLRWCGERERQGISTRIGFFLFLETLRRNRSAKLRIRKSLEDVHGLMSLSHVY